MPKFALSCHHFLPRSPAATGGPRRRRSSGPLSPRTLVADYDNILLPLGRQFCGWPRPGATSPSPPHRAGRSIWPAFRTACRRVGQRRDGAIPRRLHPASDRFGLSACLCRCCRGRAVERSATERGCGERMSTERGRHSCPPRVPPSRSGSTMCCEAIQ